MQKNVPETLNNQVAITFYSRRVWQQEAVVRKHNSRANLPTDEHLRRQLPSGSVTESIEPGPSETRCLSAATKRQELSY